MSGLGIAAVGLAFTCLNFLFILALKMRIEAESQSRLKSITKLKGELYDRAPCCHNYAVKRWLEEEWFYDKFGIELKEAKVEIDKATEWVRHCGRYPKEGSELPVYAYTETSSPYRTQTITPVSQETYDKWIKQQGEKHINECI